MSYEVPFIRPVFPESSLIGADFDAIVTNNWYTNFGPMERRFRDALAEHLGHGLAASTFNNATAALLGALTAVLGRGDRTRSVLVPSFTFAAGPAAIEWAGFRPLFIDIDIESLQPSFDDALAALVGDEHQVAAILLCNTFGIGNPRIHEWEALAAAHNLPLIIDSAAGFGSNYPDGRPVGTAGTCEIFSFHATKPFAVGEGGAVVSRDIKLINVLQSFQNFGFEAGSGAVALGLNGKLQEINAAIGLRQLAEFDAAIVSRRGALEAYRDALPNEFVFPTGIESSSVCFASILVPSQERRDELLARLLARGVEARTYYSPAVHKQPHFSRHKRISALATTDSVGGRILSLPVHQRMSKDHIDLVLSTLTED